ncbi:hypothetical protein CYLTODRAFT_440485 [Cylindrobasidium torrendii FP15055 ss-10]|uniref:BZIP domain-containing protein n=1 Tax=Cylindrobasidium torrendii FP15055 ss-10 TaxID=1314674 RepID=A0A0D7BQX7_9AGAR|nr:hypothetical protein CYLTODRAFT_440485 [Cylindrobasidium torrendii FP15055 ss-10]
MSGTGISWWAKVTGYHTSHDSSQPYTTYHSAPNACGMVNAHGGGAYQPLAQCQWRVWGWWEGSPGAKWGLRRLSERSGERFPHFSRSEASAPGQTECGGGTFPTLILGTNRNDQEAFIRAVSALTVCRRASHFQLPLMQAAPLDDPIRRRRINNIEAARRSRTRREARKEQIATRLEKLHEELQKAQAEAVELERSVAHYKGYVKALEAELSRLDAQVF